MSLREKRARVHAAPTMERRAGLYLAYWPTSNFRTFWNEFGNGDSYGMKQARNVFRWK